MREMKRTYLEARAEWEKGNYKNAYKLYCQDEGSLIMNFEEYCISFSAWLRRLKIREAI